MTNAQIDWIRKNLIAGLPTIRKSRDRQMMREAVLRIRQLTGILEVRRLIYAVDASCRVRPATVEEIDNAINNARAAIAKATS